MRSNILLYILKKNNIIIIIKLYFLKLNNNNNNKINFNKSKLKIILLKEYIKYINIFNQKKIVKFLKYRPKINYKIKCLLKEKPLYKLLYNILKSKLVILRNYIEINFILKFI